MNSKTSGPNASAGGEHLRDSEDTLVNDNEAACRIRGADCPACTSRTCGLRSIERRVTQERN
jgi:hypothetical protein